MPLASPSSKHSSTRRSWGQGNIDAIVCGEGGLSISAQTIAPGIQLLISHIQLLISHRRQEGKCCQYGDFTFY